jgi:pyruvate formate-lyase activating enzyme-like uncharacterized protein
MKFTLEIFLYKKQKNIAQEIISIFCKNLHQHLYTTKESSIY